MMYGRFIFVLFTSATVVYLTTCRIDKHLWIFYRHHTSAAHHSLSTPSPTRKEGGIVLDPDDSIMFSTTRTGSSTGGANPILKLAADPASNVLNVHIVPHTHDDVGWRKTVDQYYYGWNNSIDTRGNVAGILSTTMESLSEHPNRTFTYVEQKFLSKWWSRQPKGVRDSVRYLIENQQLAFVNGGWCMHDEATSHFMGMIDQTELGHDFLKTELGVVPTVGWQLDPFGHSATQASYMTAGMGFDALYFGRIDYQDLQLRQLSRQCEGLWNAASNQLPGTTVFWGLTGSYGGNYGAPDGFCFDALCDPDERLVGLNETVLQTRLEAFLQATRIQSDRTIDNHIMMTFGMDFNFMEAHVNFDNMDLLIASIMNQQAWGILDMSKFLGPRFDRIQIFYSNPEYYTKCKHSTFLRRKERAAKDDANVAANGLVSSAVSTLWSMASGLFFPQSAALFPIEYEQSDTPEAIDWGIKRDDFFPYSDCPNCFWTGYFSSRIAFKRFERVASSFLMAARQIDSLWNPASPPCKKRSCRPLFPLEDALGIVQHHDAISGTAKQHVADDYSKILQNGLDHAARHVSELLRRNLFEEPDFLSDFMYCQLLNETTCDASVQGTLTTNSTQIYTVVYNPLGRSMSSIVRLPVASPGLFRVRFIQPESQEQLISSTPVSGHSCCSKKYVLLVDSGPIPALSAVVFSVMKLHGTQNVEDRLVMGKVKSTTLDESNIEISTDYYTIRFDKNTGLMTRIANGETTVPFEQTWGYYTSFDSSIDNSYSTTSSAKQNSGAYIFRPSKATQDIFQLVPEPDATFVHTPVGIEVHTRFVRRVDEPCWVHQVTRVLQNKPFIEIEYTIGPIPIEDGRGKEIVTKYSVPVIWSNQTFYTDSNGLDFLRRRRNFRPSWDWDIYEPVSGNYYPVNAAIYIEDENVSSNKTALAVVVDRSQGGSSLHDGAIELMVQRRTLADDARGVDEPLNETVGGTTPYPPYGNAQRIGDGVVIRGVHRLLVGSQGGAPLARSTMDYTFADAIVFAGTSNNTGLKVRRAELSSRLQFDLPDCIFLVTMARIENLTYLVRLAHSYGYGEGRDIRTPIQLDLKNLFRGYKLEEWEERTLSGNQPLLDRDSLDWTTKPVVRRPSVSENGVLTLNPMEIHTLHLTLSPVE